MKCKARQYSDQKVCHDCRLVWDVNDPSPPDCPNQEPVEDAKKAAAIQNIMAFLATKLEDFRL